MGAETRDDQIIARILNETTSLLLYLFFTRSLIDIIKFQEIFIIKTRNTKINNYISILIKVRYVLYDKDRQNGFWFMEVGKCNSREIKQQGSKNITS